MKPSIAILSLMMLTCGSAVFGQDSRRFRWQLEAGDEYRIELNVQTSIKSNVDRRSKQIGDSLVLMLDWKVLSASGDTFTISQTIKRIQMTVRIPADEGIQTTEIDTDDTRQPTGLTGELLKQIRPLVGTTYTLTMTDRGKILTVTSPPETAAILRQDVSTSVRVGQVLTVEGLNGLLNQSATVFPETAIAVGDDWETVQTIENSFGKTSKTHRYQYDGKQQRQGIEVDVFSVTAELETEKSADAVLDFKEQGTIWFAPGQDRRMESQMENRLQTRRNYRDKAIVTTVTTVVELLMVKQP